MSQAKLRSSKAPSVDVLVKFFLLLLLGSCTCLRAQSSPCPKSPGHINLSEGEYSTGPGVSFRLRHFAAELVPMGKTSPLCYQKYTVVSHAEIFVSNESLTQVFAGKLSATESKIKDFKVVNSADGATLSGTITKLIPIHFSISGPVTTDGIGLQLHAEKINADGIPIKALLQLIGEHLSAVVGMKDVSGVTVQENTMSFFPAQIAHLKGNIRSVVTSPEGITLVYGPAAPRPRK